MFVKNTAYNGCHNGVSSSTNYMGSGTYWIANMQCEHSTEERISTFSNYNVSTPVNFHRYVLTPCLPSNTKALHIS